MATALRQRLKEDIRQYARSCAPHTRLLSIRKLVEKYGSSTDTVRYAINELCQEGLLYRGDKAMFVSDPARQIVPDIIPDLNRYEMVERIEHQCRGCGRRIWSNKGLELVCACGGVPLPTGRTMGSKRDVGRPASRSGSAAEDAEKVYRLSLPTVTYSTDY